MDGPKGAPFALQPFSSLRDKLAPVVSGLSDGLLIARPTAISLCWSGRTSSRLSARDLLVQRAVGPVCLGFSDPSYQARPGRLISVAHGLVGDAGLGHALLLRVAVHDGAPFPL